ncbi:unnamed protein product [Brassica oleracea var. botrytis]
MSMLKLNTPTFPNLASSLFPNSNPRGPSEIRFSNRSNSNPGGPSEIRFSNRWGKANADLLSLSLGSTLQKGSNSLLRDGRRRRRRR